MKLFGEFRSWALLPLGAALGWGLQYSVTENLFKNIRVLDWLTYYFFGGAACCALATAFAHRGMPSLGRSNLIPMAICVAVGVPAQAAIIAAILKKNATQASLLENAVPLFTFIFGWLIFGNSELSVRTATGAALIIGGIAVIGSA